jgi:hypothetical protein
VGHRHPAPIQEREGHLNSGIPAHLRRARQAWISPLDEGTEFVNAGLKYLYKRWNIKPISTGGYQPQAVPVERFHRFTNHAMTMLAAQFGEDWTGYLPAVTLAYNSSVTESTGYLPFALMYGREPQLMGEKNMVLGDRRARLGG